MIREKVEKKRDIIGREREGIGERRRKRRNR